MSIRFSVILGACLAASPALAKEGWQFGRTGMGLVQYFMSDQVPPGIATGKSSPGGMSVFQGFYARKGFGARLIGDLAFENEKESCFMCMDFSASGHYYWNTRYGSAGLRINPEDLVFWEGFGLSLGYARFQYEWGISETGWDSPYPSGYFLSGTYASHQATAGADYTYAFRKGRKGISLSLEMKKTLASSETFRPKMIVGSDISRFSPPERPLVTAFSVKVEL